MILQHEDLEYGAEIGADGRHSGGPFFIDVSPTMRIEDVRLIIQVRLNAQSITVTVDLCLSRSTCDLADMHIQTCTHSILCNR